MTLSEEQVRKIANLGRLKLSDEEVNKFSKDLSQILAYVENLNELNTDGIEPMVGAIRHQKELRQDASEKTDTQAMINNAPDSEETFIRVPKMS